MAYVSTRGDAFVKWTGPHGPRERTFRGKNGWGFHLAALIDRNESLRQKGRDGELDLVGVLDWDQWELDSLFTPDPTEGEDSAHVLMLSVHEE